MPAGHPVLGAASVRAHFRQRQRVRSMIASGVCKTRLLQLPPGCLNYETTRMATCGRSSEAHIWDVLTQELLHCWPVLKKPLPPQHLAWAWDRASRVLAIPCGTGSDHGRCCSTLTAAAAQQWSCLA